MSKEELKNINALDKSFRTSLKKRLELKRKNRDRYTTIKFSFFSLLILWKNTNNSGSLFFVVT